MAGRAFGLMWRVLALAATLAIAGCVHADAPSRTINFDEHSSSAIVVAGLDAPDGFRNAHMVWQLLDDSPDTRFRTTIEFEITRGNRLIAGDPETKFFQVLEVRHPGKYALIRAITHVPNAITYFEGKAPVIEVRPGEVTYIGDFYLAALLHPLQFKFNGYDDAGAAAALASQYPGIKGAIHHAPVSFAQIDLDADHTQHLHP